MYARQIQKCNSETLIKKPGLDTELKNYRPVINLSFVSRLIEEVVSTQIGEHINKHQFSENFQSAYKARHSTETSL